MTAPATELFGTRSCPYTTELREDLVWRRISFTEYDVERDAEARARLTRLTGTPVVVPVLVENGRVTQVGWHGRSCAVGPAA
ncbi:MAG TPA: Uxx-star family glutaredoxin-like (seleno)protein [Vicinamibacterales bacterium]|nr:Uxx-star family glutaredoxin-like (seleno)protein [Vicinamibacterales bacterium]